MRDPRFPRRHCRPRLRRTVLRASAELLSRARSATACDMPLGAKTPVSRFLIGTVVINSTLVSVLDARHLFNFPVFGDVVGWNYFWRLLVWQSAYGSTGEVLFGIFSLYNMSIAEGFLGSKKFAAFVAASYATTGLLVPIAHAALYSITGWSGLDVVPSGLTPTIFALLFSYHALIPAPALLQFSSPPDTPTNESQPTLQVTSKVWVYGAAVNLATCRFPGSLIGAITGWIVGSFYHRYSVLPATWRLPSVFAFLLDQKPTHTILNRRSSPHEFRTRDTLGRTQDLHDAQAQVTNRMPAPSESDIHTIMSMMNVNQEVAAQALAAAGNSMERAVENLLSR